MTTTQNKTDFLPRKLVPVGEAVLVHISGKPPKSQTRRGKDGKDVTEAVLWFGIADKNYPELIGQYHPLTAFPWISAGDPQANPPKRPNKLFTTLLAMVGPDKIKEFAFKDALLTQEALDAIEDSREREYQQRKFIHPDQWKCLRGFYVAFFKEPRKDKETGLPILDHQGGIWRQEIAEIRHPRAIRLDEAAVKDNVIWPPPRKKSEPAQASEQTGTKPPVEDKSTTPTEPAKQVEPSKELLSIREVFEEIRALYDQGAPYGDVLWKVLDASGKRKVADLAEQDQRHLWTLLKIREYSLKSHDAANLLDDYMATSGKALHQFDRSEATLWLQTMENAWAADVPF